MAQTSGLQTDEVGKARQSVLAALAVVGIKLDPDEDNTKLSAEVASRLLHRVMAEAGAEPKTHNDDTAFVAGLFGLVFCDHLTGLLGADFEIATLPVTLNVVPLPFATHDWADFHHDLVRHHNGGNQRVNQAIGNRLVAFLQRPNKETLDQLVKLFLVCQTHVRLPSAAVTPVDPRLPIVTDVNSPLVTTGAVPDNFAPLGNRTSTYLSVALMLFAIVVIGAALKSRPSSQEHTHNIGTPLDASSAGRAEMQNGWSTIISHQTDGAINAVIYERKHLSELIGNKSCAQARADSADFYSDRRHQGLSVRTDMVEERMAVEFFACHPEASTWSSDK